jgi:hypothetical protein
VNNDTPALPAIARRDKAALAAVVALGAVLRLYGLGTFSLWYDEGATTFLSQFAASPANLFDVTKTTEPPLNAILTWLWLGLIGLFSDAPVTSATSDFLIRLLPCLFSIASLPLVFLVGRVIFRDNVSALLATLLIAVNPFQIYYAQELRIYAVYVFLWLGAVYCLVKALEGGGWYWWAGLVACEVLAVYSHFISVWTVFTINVFFLCAIWHYRRHLWKWVVSQALVVLLVAPILPTAFYLNKVLDTKTVDWYPDITLMTGVFTFKDLFAGYGATPWAYWGIFLFGGILCAVGILSCWRRWPMGILLIVLVVVPVLGNLATWSVRSFSFYEHRLFIFSGVAAVLAAAQGLRVLKWRPAIALATALYVGLTLPLLRDHYLGRLHPEPSHRIAVYDKVDLRSAAAHIEDHWQERDLVAHASHFTVYSVDHYLRSTLVPRARSPRSLPDRPHLRLGMNEDDARFMLETFGPVQQKLLTEHGLMPVPVEQATASAERVWWIETFGNTFEWKPLTDPIRGWLDEHFNRIEQVEFSGVLLVLYERK